MTVGSRDPAGEGGWLIGAEQNQTTELVATKWDTSGTNNAYFGRKTSCASGPSSTYTSMFLWRKERERERERDGSVSS